MVRQILTETCFLESMDASKVFIRSYHSVRRFVRINCDSFPGLDSGDAKVDQRLLSTPESYWKSCMVTPLFDIAIQAICNWRGDKSHRAVVDIIFDDGHLESNDDCNDCDAYLFEDAGQNSFTNHNYQKYDQNSQFDYCYI